MISALTRPAIPTATETFDHAAKPARAADWTRGALAELDRHLPKPAIAAAGLVAEALAAWALVHPPATITVSADAVITLAVTDSGPALTDVGDLGARIDPYASLWDVQLHGAGGNTITAVLPIRHIEIGTAR
jgi:hypothetical protein